MGNAVDRTRGLGQITTHALCTSTTKERARLCGRHVRVRVGWVRGVRVRAHPIGAGVRTGIKYARLDDSERPSKACFYFSRRNQLLLL